MPIIFSTCWYLFKAKFDSSVFQQWIHNMLSNVNNYYLIIYTDESSKSFVIPYESNPRIKIIIKPIETFYNYKYREHWISNHEKNSSLNNITDWRVNMLWSEKIHFVNETINTQYFDIQNALYGWCDIGYFRNRNGPMYYDTNIEELSLWPSEYRLSSLQVNKIHYACINNNPEYIKQLIHLVNNRSSNGLPNIPIPPHQQSIAGGFFILDKSMIEWWKTTYDTTLNKYFKNGYLVKDDQIIVADCIFSNLSKFALHTENSRLDNWFMFQRLLNR